MLLVRDVMAGRAHVAEIRTRLYTGQHVHLLGMAGFGMAGLALMLQERGLSVTGCDLVQNRISKWLSAHGFCMCMGHDVGHLEGVSWIVRSTAVPDSCPEVRTAYERGLPVEHRGFVLPALLSDRFSVAVSGTHGKTTVSAMIAQVLQTLECSPSFCIGGEVEALGGVAGVGAGACMVVEADESDGTLVLYEPDVAVITNVEFDHMEHFETPEALERCFEVFADSARQTTVYCIDDPRAASICASLNRALSYGLDPHADVQVTIRQSRFGQTDIVLRGPDGAHCKTTLPLSGLHNVRNAAAAWAVALTMGLDGAGAASALSRFVPVKRRLEVVAQTTNFCVVTDYGHHPTEICAVMDVLATWPHKRLMVIFQPHRYTRTLALGRDFPPAFDGATEVLLLPVYAASEKPLLGGTSDDLLKHFREISAVPARLLESLDEAWNYLRANVRAGDVWLIIGAGDIEQVAWRAQAEWGVPRAGRQEIG